MNRPDPETHLGPQLLAPELQHGLPGAFGRPEHLHRRLVAGLANQQRRFAFLAHPAARRWRHLHLRTEPNLLNQPTPGGSPIGLKGE